LLIGLGQAEDLFVGKPPSNWKFNPQKSKVDRPENFKDRRQHFVPVGPNAVQLTETYIGPDGKLRSFVDTITLDGKEHMWKDGTQVTYVRLDDRHIHGTLKRNGHSQRVDAEISNDGKALTLHVNGSALGDGRAINNVEVYDRE
jgi:hypothetical protein